MDGLTGSNFDPATFPPLSDDIRGVFFHRGGQKTVVVNCDRVPRAKLVYLFTRHGEHVARSEATVARDSAMLTLLFPQYFFLLRYAPLSVKSTPSKNVLIFCVSQAEGCHRRHRRAPHHAIPRLPGGRGKEDPPGPPPASVRLFRSFR